MPYPVGSHQQELGAEYSVGCALNAADERCGEPATHFVPLSSLQFL